MRDKTNGTQESFLVRHVAIKLEAEGYAASDVDRGCNEALRFYRTTATFGRRGGDAFQSCLTKARVLLQPSKNEAKRNLSKRKKVAA